MSLMLISEVFCLNLLLNNTLFYLTTGIIFFFSCYIIFKLVGVLEVNGCCHISVHFLSFSLEIENNAFKPFFLKLCFVCLFCRSTKSLVCKIVVRSLDLCSSWDYQLFMGTLSHSQDQALLYRNSDSTDLTNIFMAIAFCLLPGIGWSTDPGTSKHRLLWIKIK